MAQPTTSVAVQRNDLAGAFTEFDPEANRRGFIAQRVLPKIDVAKQSGQYPYVPVEQILPADNDETDRAIGASYSRGYGRFQMKNYSTVEHGREEVLDDREAAIYSELIDGELMATSRAMNKVLIDAEKRAAAALFNASTWTGSSLTTAITNEWDDLPNATPIDDVESAVKKVYDGTGLWANALILNRKVYRNLRRCKQVQDLMKQQDFVDVRPGRINEMVLAQVFDLDYIIVAGGTKNAAKEGQNASLSQIWSDEYVMVARVAVTNDIAEACVGRTFHWTGDGSEIDGLVEQYREEAVRGEIYRVRHETQEVVLYKEAAHLLSNATT